MHVYISADMEGVAGIATWDQTIRGGHGYRRAQELMTSEANAAIEGAFDGGATSVTISDSHGTMDNLLHDQLDERAQLVFGKPRAQCMVHGLDARYDVAMFVGYHAAVGEIGVLSHTFSSLFGDVRLNGATVSEAEVNALYAASRGVPIGLVSGDDAACAAADKRFADVVTVTVKHVEGWSAARSMHPHAARAAIREAAARAVGNAPSLRPITLPSTFVLEVRMPSATAAELATLIPGVEPVDALAVRRDVANPDELLGLISLWSELAAAGERGRVALLQR